MVCALVVSMASVAWANVPDLDESFATSANGAELMSVYCLPDGQGNGFDEAFRLDMGNPTYDCTITLTVNNAAGNPIEGWPSQDMWLETTDDGLAACPNGAAADFNTDEDGITTWQAPLNAGGSSGGELCQVMISGAPLNHPALPIQFNSADMTGDGVVNLGDIAMFAGVYLDELDNDYSADFFWTGVVNLSDLTMFAQSIGAACP